ncbi:MAG: hypothetical protein N4A47_02250 [Clostridia bacterium]|jgi:hypothetical protein|nr:hypothetical protein [Clostridia bacterium]
MCKNKEMEEWQKELEQMNYEIENKVENKSAIAIEYSEALSEAMGQKTQKEAIEYAGM